MCSVAIMDALLILPTKELMNYWAEGRILFKALWHLKRDKKHLQNLSLSYTYYSFLIFYLMLFIWSCCTACGILVPQGGTELTPPALKAQSLNHWITREVPQFLFFWSLLLCLFFFFSPSSLHWIFYSSQSQPWPLIMAKIHWVPTQHKVLDDLISPSFL